VATYYANSYTSGSGTLVDAAIRASGLTNVAAALGLSGTARLPLETLIMARPELLVAGEGRYTAPALANQNFVHPAYLKLAGETASVAVPAKYTICGAPFTAEAARMMREAAEGAGR
jgi:iron complex transport system substrate-binding protein